MLAYYCEFAEFRRENSNSIEKQRANASPPHVPFKSATAYGLDATKIVILRVCKFKVKVISRVVIKMQSVDIKAANPVRVRCNLCPLYQTCVQPYLYDTESLEKPPVYTVLEKQYL